MLKVTVPDFEALVVIEVKGGAVEITHGSMTWSNEIKVSREPATVVLVDLDSNPGVDIFNQVVHEVTGETLAHYKATIMGLDEEQRLEPETQEEFNESTG